MKPKRVLVAYSASSTNVATTFEYLKALKGLSDCEVQFVHCTNDARMHFDINKFDVLIHNYCARLCYDWYLSSDYERAVLSFRGLKIAIVQDDYDLTAVLHRAIRRFGFHVLFTSIQNDFWPLVYPSIHVPGVAIRSLFTGYAPTAVRELKPLHLREYPIAYRGRQLGAKYGKLGYEKFEIGRRMAEICDGAGIPHNIATDDQSRIYGEEWLTFIGNSRTMLGSESGSNAFDFDGEIERKCEEFTATNGRRPQYPDLADFLLPFEKPFDVGQISPRVFECVAMKTPMILFRGRYSDAIKPDVHYIPLEKDFSNVDGILGKLNDFDFLQGFADRAYNQLIASGKYSYRVLTTAIKDAIDEFYPVVTTNAAVRHRYAIAQPWKARHDPSNPHEIALKELPTEGPELPHHLEQKSELLNELLQRKDFATTQGKPPAIQGVQKELAEPANRKMGSIRRMWRLFPRPIRYRIGPRLADSLRDLLVREWPTS